MATEKPRLSISMDDDTFAKVLAYKKEKGIATQSKAIIQIMEMGLKDLEREAKQNNSSHTEETKLTDGLPENYYKLSEGNRDVIDKIISALLEQQEQGKG